VPVDGAAETLALECFTAPARPGANFARAVQAYNDRGPVTPVIQCRCAHTMAHCEQALRHSQTADGDTWES